MMGTGGYFFWERKGNKTPSFCFHACGLFKYMGAMVLHGCFLYTVSISQCFRILTEVKTEIFPGVGNLRM